MAKKFGKNTRFLLRAALLGMIVTGAGTLYPKMAHAGDETTLPSHITAHDDISNPIGHDYADRNGGDNAIYNDSITDSAGGDSTAFCNNYSEFGPGVNGHTTQYHKVSNAFNHLGAIETAIKKWPATTSTNGWKTNNKLMLRFIMWMTSSGVSGHDVMQPSHVVRLSAENKKLMNDAVYCIKNPSSVASSKPNASCKVTSQSPSKLTYTVNVSGTTGVSNAKIYFSGIPGGAQVKSASGRVLSSGSPINVPTNKSGSGSTTFTVNAKSGQNLDTSNFNIKGHITGKDANGGVAVGNYEADGSYAHKQQEITVVRNYSYPINIPFNQANQVHQHSISWNQPVNLKVQKFSKKHHKPMKGVHFSLIDPDGHVDSSAVTGDDGIGLFKDINPNGKYPQGTHMTIREDSSDADHTTNNHQTMPFDMPGDPKGRKSVKWGGTEKQPSLKAPSMSKRATQTFGPLTFYDTAIPNEPNIRSYAREPSDMGVTTGTQHVDAKNEHLKDTLDIHHLDGGRKYRVVDELVNPETLKPVEIDGHYVKGTQDFTAAGQHRNEHPGKQLTFDYQGVNFKTLADHDYIFNAKIYDPAADQTSSSNPNGNLLGEEGTNTNDSNREMSDASQRIWVNKINAQSQANANDQPGACGKQTINPYSKTNLYDKVTANGLVNKHQYTINEKVMEKDGNNVKPLTKDGKEVTTSKDFTADGLTDTENVDLPQFSTTNLAGKNLVIYYNVTPKNQSDDILFKGDNPHDCNESIHITNPKMHTTALIDNDKESNPSTQSRLKDEVRYSGIAPNQPITLAAMAANKDGKAIKVPGTPDHPASNNYIAGKYNFTPTGSNGIVDVPLREIAASGSGDPSIKSASARASLNRMTPINDKDVTATDKSYDVNTSNLAGRDMVMFEDLYNQGDTPIATYDSTEDTDETIHIAAPKIVSHALADGEKEANPGTNTHITDRVKYVDAAPNHPLDFSSMVMNPKTQQPVVGKDTDGKDFNLMGRKIFTPSDKKGEERIPIQEVQQGQPAKTSSGAVNDANSVNINDMIPKKMSDDPQVKQIQKFVDGLPNTGESGTVKSIAQSKINQLDGYLYDGRAGEPKDMSNALSELGDAVKGKTSISSVDLSKAEKALGDYKAALSNDVGNGSLMTQKQFDNKKEVNNQVGSKGSKAADATNGSKASSGVSKASSGASSTVTSSSNSSTGSEDLSASSANGSSSSDNTDSGDAKSENAALKRVSQNHLSDNGEENNSSAQTSNQSNKASSASNSDGSTSEYDINTKALRGQSLDAYEDVTNPDDGNKTDIAGDDDPSNSDQTVHISAPQIRTEQTVNGDKSASTSKRDDFTDKVKYTNVAPHQPLALDSVEMQQGTSNPVTIDGRYLVGHKTFTPDNANGSTDVELETTHDHPLSKWIQEDLTSDGNPTDPKQPVANSANSVKPSKAVKNDKKAGDDDMNDVPADNKGQGTSNSADSSSSSSSSSSADNNKSDDSAESADSSDMSNTNDDDDDEGTGHNTSRNGVDLTPLDHTGESNYHWVAFETAENPKNDTVVAEHKKPNDASQTVTLNVPKPKRKKKPHCCPTNVKIFNKGPKAQAQSRAQSTPGEYGTLQNGTGGGQPYNSAPSSHSAFSGPELQFARTSGPKRAHRGIVHKIHRWIAAHF